MNKNTHRFLLAAGLLTAGFGLTACPTDPAPTDSGPPPRDTPATDTPPDPTDAPADAPALNDCATYCSVVTASCSGADAQYESAAECARFCAGSDWPDGTPGANMGNTLACRIYHAGVAAGAPGTHCVHAGPTGGAVCGAGIVFMTGAGTRVDRMGMPVVSTALIPGPRKNAYNDASPSDDVTGTPPTFFNDLATGLGALHTALDDDLTTAGLAPCSLAPADNIDTMTPFGVLPECIGQPIGTTGTPPVAALVLPDTLVLDPALPSGFPNGRQLDDSVVDPILAAILLDLRSTTGCAGGPCTVGTLAGLSAGMGLNPQANDSAFSTTFPYLAAAHTVP